MNNRDHYTKAFSDILSLRDLAESTIKNYISYLNQFLDFLVLFLGDTLPEDVTWEQLRTYILYLKNDRKLNNRSINPHIAQLRDFFRYVLHRDWDPYQVPFLKFNSYLPAVPTKQEMEHIIMTMQDLMYQCILAIMYSAGLRISEAVRLTYDDISRTNMQIHVAVSKNREERKAILAKKTLDMLTNYWYRCGRPKGYLFPGQKPETHISTESVRLVMKRHLQAIGMQAKGYTPHSCRHCFGLVLYQSGAELLAIRGAMGQKCLSSTVVYASLGIGSDHGLISPFDMED